MRDVLDFYKNSDTLIRAKSRIAGLTLRATDTDWTHGEGPVVEGRLMDLLMAATGRKWRWTASAATGGDLPHPLGERRR